MINQFLLTEVSRQLLSKGIKLLQGYRFGNTDASHIAVLLGYMDPRPNTHWLDIGSGFGEAARLISQLRLDLKFTLVNNNKFQIENTPAEFTTVEGDMHALPFKSGTYDGAMFLYSLCNADNLTRALSEAARVVRKGGELFVYDYVRRSGDNLLSQELLSANFFPASILRYIGSCYDWHTVFMKFPPGSDAVFREIVGNDQTYDRLFGDLTPVVWKAVHA